MVLSELSGRANILYKTREFGLDTELNKQQIETLLDELKRLGLWTDEMRMRCELYAGYLNRHLL